MATLDIIILVCFIPAIVSGISKGFVKQLVDIAALVVGIIAASRLSSVVSDWLGNYVTWDKNVLYIVSFAIVVIVVVIILNLIGSLICRLLQAVSLGWVNRLFGLVFAVLKAAIVLGLLIMLFKHLNASLNLVDTAKYEDAALFNWLGDMVDRLFPYFKNLVSGSAGITSTNA